MSTRSERLSVHRALEVARGLAFPRYSGTAGNRRAVAALSRWFQATGLEVNCEEFGFDVGPAFRALRVLLLATAALLAVASGLLGSHPRAALLLVLVAIAGAGALLSWSPWLEALYRHEGRTRAFNIEARRRGRSDGPVLILLAHHDSKSQNLSLPFRAGLTLLALAAGFGLLGISTLRSLAPAVEMSPAWPLSLGLAASISLVVLSTLRNGNKSPGGVDNAGSVGILVDLAHRLPERVKESVELIFLSPGAEEDHMVGAMRWLDRHAGELSNRQVWAINIDGAGIPGRVTLLERYGLGQWFSRQLSAVARRAAERLQIPVRGILMPPAMGVDAIPFSHRHIPCLTLTSGSLGRASLAVHSSQDRFEHLDSQALAQVRDLILVMVDELMGDQRPQGAGAAAPTGSSE